MNRTGNQQDSSAETVPPVHYQLISPDGHPMGAFDTPLEAASAAGGFWPGVGQTDDEITGWNILRVPQIDQPVGARS